MIRVAGEMEKQRFSIPLLIGGAAASMAHTALRIAPAYSGPVVYVRDAGESPGVLHALFSAEKPRFLAKLNQRYEEARRRHEAITEQRSFLSLEETRRRRLVTDWEQFRPPEPELKDPVYYDDYPPEDLFPRIDWEEFYRFWNSEKSRPEKARLREDAETMLRRIVSRKLLSIRGALGFFPAFSDGDDVVVSGPGGSGRFCFLRNQKTKAAFAEPGIPNLCLADYVPPRGSGPGWIGLFALSSGFGLDKAAAAYREQGDDYGALLLGSLADRLAEAFAEDIHRRLETELWKLPPCKIIRPAFGYPACPDHHDKKLCLDLLDAEKRIGLTLSESAMIIPAQSLCGMLFAHPKAVYFGTGEIAEDQINDWARRKGISTEEARRRTGWI
jgi:5-methyltetrahydrofolate--homocysteine methyltransferase